MGMSKEEFTKRFLEEQRKRKIKKAKKEQKDIDDYIYRRTVERRRRLE